MATLREYTSSLPGKRMGAGVLFTDETGRLLLVEPTYKPTWEIPGGAMEADESPRDARNSDWTEGVMVVFAGPC